MFKLKKSYILFFTLFMLYGYGGNALSNVNNKNSDYFNESTSSSENILDSNSSYIFSSAFFDKSCENKEVFSLYPPLKDIVVKFMKYSPSVENIDSANIEIFQKSNEDNRYELDYDVAGKRYFKQCVDVTYNSKSEIYPAFKIVAKNNDETVEDRVVLFDSKENNCKNCHKSNSFENAKPLNGWANLNDEESDFKINILRLHDEKYLDKVKEYFAKLNKDIDSLENISKNKLINCSDCHHVMAISGSGLNNIAPLDIALHKTHSNLKDPYNSNMQSCITCHPGDEIMPFFGNSIMHKRGFSYIQEHKNINESEVINCTLCHGYDYKGSFLSKVLTPFSTIKYSYNKGDIVSCFDCHTSSNDWSLIKK